MRRYRFRPRVLRDISNVDMRVELFGEWVESPILVAPTAMQKLAHHEGELATAKGIPYILVFEPLVTTFFHNLMYSLCCTGHMHGTECTLNCFNRRSCCS